MAQSTASLRIGTRGSPLALVQARMVRARLAAAMGMNEDGIELVVIRTSGDLIQDRSLAEEGGKGLFTKEIEEALLDRRIDLAVHSAKDMPTILPKGLATRCMPGTRGPARCLHQPQGAFARGIATRRKPWHCIAAPAGDRQARAARSPRDAPAWQCGNAAAQTRGWRS